MPSITAELWQGAGPTYIPGSCAINLHEWIIPLKKIEYGNGDELFAQEKTDQ